MSERLARAGLREMLRLPRPGARWPAWRWIATFAVTLSLGVIARRLGRVWTWVLLATLLGLGLGWVPLFGVLGFELALATAVFAAVMGLDVGSAFARTLQRLPAAPAAVEAAAAAPAAAEATAAAPSEPAAPAAPPRARTVGRTLARSTVTAALLAAAIVAIPGGIAAVRGLWVPTCDWWFGLEAYLVMPIATALLAGATGHALGMLTGPRRVVGAAVAQLPALLIAAAALHRFYSAPPVFTYNAILGYFPGNLYDENVQLTAALLWSRLEQALWVIALLAAVALWLDLPRLRVARAPRPGGRRGGAIVLLLAAGASALGLRLQAGQLGYAIDAGDIEHALGGRLETPHFVIHYARTPEVEEVIGLVAADHEFRYAQVVGQLGVAPAGKLRSFYFASRDQKARWIGARDVEMAKPWRREIYLEHRGFPHSSLRHEIAHAVASEFGDPLFGVASRRVLGLPLLASPGLIEGLAVALDWPGGRYLGMTPHEAVRVLQELGARPSIGSLLSLQFFGVSSTAGYTTAGSFLRYLLDRHGAARLRAVYASGGDFAAAYGKPLAALEAEWLAMTRAIELPRAAIEASRERFRGTSVFARPCPHAIAARRERAQRALAAGDRSGAVTLMRAVCGDAPEEPRHRLDLGTVLYAGAPAERAEALALWTALARDGERVTSTLRAEALENLARAAAARGEDAEVKRLIAEAAALPVDGDAGRQLQALAYALDHAGPAGAALRGYFFGGASRIDLPTWARLATLAEPRLGLGHYLLGLQHLSRGELGDGAAALARSLVLGLPGLAFVQNAARRLAVAAYRTGDAAQLATAITALSGAQMTEVERLLARDWLDRAAFDAAAAPPTSPR